MDVASQLHGARRAAGLSQRELARAAGTSQATVSAYEAGRKVPTVATLDRLLGACGASLEVGRPRLERAGRHLAEALALAEALPHRPAPRLRYPRLPAAR
jgi:transcriptional regulator with XRE-family HTH domain